MSETLTVRDVESGRVQELADLGTVHELLEAGQVVPLREDGTPARVQELAGGFVVDGEPLSVAMGGEWEEGQRELLEPYWRNGQIPRPADQPAPTARTVDATAKPNIGILVAAGVLGFFLGRHV